MQSAHHVYMLRPASFAHNGETAASNHFQNEISQEGIGTLALKEFDKAVATLRENGVQVVVFEDSPIPAKPDAIFPNNWISLLHDGTMVLYPMLAKNRRLERRQDIIGQLKQDFAINKVLDLSDYESKNMFLEGTGSIVFNHTKRKAYACLSPRTNKQLLEILLEKLNYQLCCFTAKDKQQNDIYHTNVMMNIGLGYAVICLESVVDEKEKKSLIQNLKEDDLEIVEISLDQMNDFAGNMLEVQGKERLLALSNLAFKSLNSRQIKALEDHVRLLPITVSTIEKVGGGGIRCMICEIFCPPRP